MGEYSNKASIDASRLSIRGCTRTGQCLDNRRIEPRQLDLP